LAPFKDPKNAEEAQIDLQLPLMKTSHACREHRLAFQELVRDSYTSDALNDKARQPQRRRSGNRGRPNDLLQYANTLAEVKALFFRELLLPYTVEKVLERLEALEDLVPPTQDMRDPVSKIEPSLCLQKCEARRTDPRWRGQGRDQLQIERIL